MRVSLISEGTYPHSFGGVSVWCDQLVRRSTSVDFTLVSLVATGTEQPVLAAAGERHGPDHHPAVGTGGPAPVAALPQRPLRVPRRCSGTSCGACSPSATPAPSGGSAQVLRLLFDFAQREDLSAALGSEDALAVLTRAWSEPWSRARHAGDDAERRRHRPGAARPLAAAAGPPAGGHRGGALRGERARGAAGAGRPVDARLGPAPHRARRLPARALPRATAGAPTGGRSRRCTWRSCGCCAPTPTAQAALITPGNVYNRRGSSGSAPIPASSGRSTTGSTRPSSRRSRASPPSPPSAGPGVSTPSRTCTP